MTRYLDIRNARRAAQRRANRIDAIWDGAIALVLIVTLACGLIGLAEAMIEADAARGMTVSQSLESWGL